MIGDPARDKDTANSPGSDLRTQQQGLPCVLASDPTGEHSGLSGLQKANMSKERATGIKERQSAFAGCTCRMH